MSSWTPRSASASARSCAPAKWTTNLPPPREDASTVSGPAAAGSVRSTVPAANRSSGTSVHGSTKTSPRTPRAGPTRPIAIQSLGESSGSTAALAPVDVDDVDADALAADAGDHLSQRLPGAAAAADHPAEIVRVHADLEPLTATVVDHVHPDVVRVVDDPAHEVLEGLLEHVSSPPASTPRPAQRPPRREPRPGPQRASRRRPARRSSSPR